MKLCSINNIELKKKVKILSKSELSNLGSKPEKIYDKDNNNYSSIEIEKKNSVKQSIISKKDISGLSLSSLKAKKVIKNLALDKKKEEKSSGTYNSKFDQKSLEQSWKKFQTKISKSGRKNLESILSISNPELKENDKVEYTLTNNTSKLELNKNKNELIDFLKKDLKNDNISIEVKVNKLKEKKFIYTPTEKYDKLKKLNPNIETLRKEFKLNL